MREDSGTMDQNSRFEPQQQHGIPREFHLDPGKKKVTRGPLIRFSSLRPRARARARVGAGAVEWSVLLAPYKSTGNA